MKKKLERELSELDTKIAKLVRKEKKMWKAYCVLADTPMEAQAPERWFPLADERQEAWLKWHAVVDKMDGLHERVNAIYLADAEASAA